MCSTAPRRPGGCDSAVIEIVQGGATNHNCNSNKRRPPEQIVQRYKRQDDLERAGDEHETIGAEFLEPGGVDRHEGNHFSSRTPLPVVGQPQCLLIYDSDQTGANPEAGFEDPLEILLLSIQPTWKDGQWGGVPDAV